MPIQTDRFLIRKMTSTDHPAYLQLVESESGIQITNDAQFQSIFLSRSSENTLILSLLTVPDNHYIGYVAIKHIDTTVPELGISLLPNYQGHGIGVEALQLAAREYAAAHPVDHYLLRVKGYNRASQRTMEKLGAYRLEDEGDLMLEELKRMTAEIGTEESHKILEEYLQTYDAEQENVLRYRYDI